MDTLKDLNKICNSEIHFAPLQGYTDIAYYSAFSIIFRGVDFYYTPYFSIDDDLSANIDNIPSLIFNQIIPQILPKNLKELKLLLAFVVRHNFSKININLGCPFPMVTKKGRGAALIGAGKVVAEMIDFVNEHSNLQVSIKTRIGMEDGSEILNLLDALALKEIESIIIHPRTAKQLYKGSVSWPVFQKCRELYPHFDFIYNGDITNLENFNEIQKLLLGQQKWMIGRGLLSNPFLAGQIKGLVSGIDSTLLNNFILTMIEKITIDSKNPGHALNRIKTQFYYLSNAFPDKQRIIRKIKRIKTVDELKEILGIGG